MNIKQEKLTDLVSQLAVEVVEQDYQVHVKKALNNYQQKANIPGFRPGKVPFGMIQKMYGKAVLVDEVNKLLSDALNKHIDDNKLEILGQPIPAEDNDVADFDHAKDFTFKFDLAVAPTFELDLSKIKITNHQITLSDAEVQKSVDDLRERFKDGEKSAELNQDFFDQVFGKDAVKSEKEMRERIRRDGEKSFQQYADQKFLQDAIDAVVAETKVELPDEFLKRWLFISNREKELTQEQINADYDRYRNMLKWQLIEGKIIQSHDIKVDRNEVKNYYIEHVVSRYFPIPEDEEGRKRIEDFAETMMQNQKDTQQIYNQVYDQKVGDVLRAEMKVTHQKTDSNEYLEMVKKLNVSEENQKEKASKKSEEKATEKSEEKTDKEPEKTTDLFGEEILAVEKKTRKPRTKKTEE